MNSWPKILIVLLVLPMFLVSCGSKAPEEEWKPKRAKVKVAPKVNLAKEKKAKIKSMEREMMAKGPENNPFLSHIIVRKGVETEEELRGPLECCAISLFRLLAVVVGSESSYALLQAPDSKRYIVRKGDMVGTRGGKVIRIDNMGLTVRENSYNSSGKVVSSSDTALMLPISN
ncbi:MAG: pilus assembly protein PilP [Proteobacteria bacterium]|nr:pilus assembly protein PilP [Pseudomonadota bacterium]